MGGSRGRVTTFLNGLKLCDVTTTGSRPIVHHADAVVEKMSERYYKKSSRNEKKTRNRACVDGTVVFAANAHPHPLSL